MIVNESNYNKVREDMIAYLRSEIDKYVAGAGSRDQLSAALGRAENFVRLKLSRCEETGKIDPLEDLLEECRSKIKGDR